MIMIVMGHCGAFVMGFWIKPQPLTKLAQWSGVQHMRQTWFPVIVLQTRTLIRPAHVIVTCFHPGKRPQITACLTRIVMQSLITIVIRWAGEFAVGLPRWTPPLTLGLAPWSNSQCMTLVSANLIGNGTQNITEGVL
jgi:hypothetical protein